MSAAPAAPPALLLLGHLSCASWFSHARKRRPCSPFYHRSVRAKSSARCVPGRVQPLCAAAPGLSPARDACWAPLSRRRE